jgi:phage repressor protein C with HTH and peptisase S24 domain
MKTQRPPFLDADPRAFAILMPDASMMPRFDAGDMLYASPARALSGDRMDVVVERADGGFSVSSLVGANTDSLRLATLSPRTRESLQRTKVRGVYRIVGVQRLGA